MTWWSRNTLSPSASDRWLTAVTRSCAIGAAAVVVLVLVFLLAEAMPALVRLGVLRFFTDDSWHPLSQQFSLLPMLAGTLLTTAGALLLAAPLGLATAVVIRFLAPRPVAVVFQRLVEVLAGIPSVVFGVWGLNVLVPIVSGLGGSGQCLLTATLVLGLMILPTVALTSSAALRMVPAELITGGAALGLNRLAIARRIAIPAAQGGIAAGLLLAVARALGETIAVLMLAGNVARWPGSVLDPIRTLTANIALELGYAGSAHRSVLFVSGVLLMAVVMLFVLLTKLLSESDRDGQPV